MRSVTGGSVGFGRGSAMRSCRVYTGARRRQSAGADLLHEPAGNRPVRIFSTTRPANGRRGSSPPTRRQSAGAGLLHELRHLPAPPLGVTGKVVAPAPHALGRASPLPGLPT